MAATLIEQASWRGRREPPPGAPPDPADRLRQDTAAVRVSFTWFGTRKALTAGQKAEAAGAFGAEGKFLSAGKKLLDTRHPKFQAVTAVKGRATAYWRSLSLPYPEPGVRLIRRDSAGSPPQPLTGRSSRRPAETTPSLSTTTPSSGSTPMSSASSTIRSSEASLSPDRFVRQADPVPRDRLAGLFVIVIGVGAAGRQLALQRACLGVPKLTLVDFDAVEPTNVTTQG